MIVMLNLTLAMTVHADDVQARAKRLVEAPRLDAKIILKKAEFRPDETEGLCFKTYVVHYSVHKADSPSGLKYARLIGQCGRSGDQIGNSRPPIYTSLDMAEFISEQEGPAELFIELKKWEIGDRTHYARVYGFRSLTKAVAKTPGGDRFEFAWDIHGKKNPNLASVLLKRDDLTKETRATLRKQGLFLPR
jgi:hypothetical protein